MWLNKYLIFSLILVLSSCSSHKNTKENALLYFGKTRCLGKCPVFDMYVFDNGHVWYEGFENVSVLGKKKLKLKEDEISYLKKELNQLNFSSQDNLKRDIPNIVLKYKGKKMIIQDKTKLKNLLDFLEKVTP